MAVSYSAVDRSGPAWVGTAVSFLVLLLAVALQSTWPPWLRLGHQVPEFALLAVITIGLTTGGLSGLVAGFLGAFLWAAVAGVPMGNLFVSYMSLGFLSGAMRGRMFSERLSLALILVTAGVVIAAVIGLILAPPPSPQAWVSAVFTRALYTGLLAIPLYPLIRLLARYYPEPEEIT